MNQLPQKLEGALIDGVLSSDDPHLFIVRSLVGVACLGASVGAILATIFCLASPILSLALAAAGLAVAVVTLRPVWDWIRAEG